VLHWFHTECPAVRLISSSSSPASMTQRPDQYRPDLHTSPPSASVGSKISRQSSPPSASRQRSLGVTATAAVVPSVVSRSKPVRAASKSRESLTLAQSAGVVKGSARRRPRVSEPEVGPEVGVDTSRLTPTQTSPVDCLEARIAMLSVSKARRQDRRTRVDSDEMKDSDSRLEVQYNYACALTHRLQQQHHQQKQKLYKHK
jgi:hypothetical protein